MQRIKISPTQENMTPVLQEILKTVQDDTVLEFENAEYHFYREGAHVGFFAPSNNWASIKSVVFTLFDKKNLTVEGNGARFIFHGRISPFIIQRCDDLVLKDFSVDFAFPRIYQAEVVESNEDHLDLLIDKSRFPYSIADGKMIYHLEESDYIPGYVYLFHCDADMEIEGKHWPRRWNMGHLVAGFTLEELEAAGCNMPVTPMVTRATELGNNVVRFTHRPESIRHPYRKGSRLAMHFEPQRDNDTFFLEECRQVLFDNVTVYRGPSMGIIAQVCDNITLDRFQIRCKEGRDDLITTTADSMMFVDCAGKITVKNSYIGQSLDDGLNLHGTYTKLYKVDSHTVLAELVHREQRGFNPYHAGDLLNILDEETLAYKAKVTVAESQLCDDLKHIRLHFSEALPEQITCGNYIENYTRMPELEVVDSTFYRSTGLLISTPKKVVIARNHIHTLCEAIRLRDCPGVWMESGRIKDALVTENFFDHCCEWVNTAVGACFDSNGVGIKEILNIINIDERLRRKDSKPDIHENIVITKNKFVGRNMRLVSANCTNNLEISYNVYEGENALSLRSMESPFSIDCCSNVRIFNNDMRL